ncbi:SDR family NAD(P)-dependent oxidoreductase [Methanosphaerula palustris]|uniref:SDR family NAD(P)-dependent oxidoreductase n=1 Tax=Methanosphaerula palustris TaxID=475088 RepID=UPI00018492E6|nr:SDR family NAD(P)-dependent oxidoreductase [Methanosphaerula palustris]
MNAGGEIHELDLADRNQVIDVNLKEIFLCDKYAVTQRLKQGHGGAIVNTGSILSFVALPGIPAYCGSKGGITC